MVLAFRFKFISFLFFLWCRALLNPHMFCSFLHFTGLYWRPLRKSYHNTYVAYIISHTLMPMLKVLILPLKGFARYITETKDCIQPRQIRIPSIQLPTMTLGWPLPSFPPPYFVLILLLVPILSIVTSKTFDCDYEFNYTLYNNNEVLYFWIKLLCVGWCGHEKTQHTPPLGEFRIQ